jgi:hypothetical protein
MALTKRQKVLVAVFVVGSAALIVDRIWLRPEAASADSPPESTAQASSATSRPSASVTPDKPSVAQRLDRLWPDREPNFSDVRDPFCLPRSWSGVQKDGPAAARDPAAAFATAHRLSAVLLEGQISYALVGDRFLTPGQEIDGFTLVSVGERFAVFEGQGGRVVLKLANE